MRCCAGDEGRPFGVALREGASNRPPGPWLKTVVLSGVGKGALDVSGRDQEGERKRIADEVSKNIRVTSKPGCINYPGMSLAGARLLARWCPACRRREPGLRLPRGTGEGVSRYCPAAEAGGREGGPQEVLMP